MALCSTPRAPLPVRSPAPSDPTVSGIVTADFNGDGRLDIFQGNAGVDFVGDAGAVNTLILSRPDGRLEDASGKLLAPPCNLGEPVFAGQHMCFGGSDYGDRTPGIRYPGPGAPVPPARDFSGMGRPAVILTTMVISTSS